MIFDIKKIFEKYNERIAYIFGEEKITYGELFENAKKISSVLLNGDSSPVVIYGDKNPSVIEGILACILAKRAYVPIDTSAPKGRREKIIGLSKSTVILDCCGKSPILKHLGNVTKATEENKFAYIIFTSGSTGEPKGVPISYENLDNFIGWITTLSPLNRLEHGTVLNHAGFGFDLSTASIYYSFFGGHSFLQLTDANDFCEVFDTIYKNKPNLIIAVPSFLRLLMLNNEFDEKNFPFVKQIYFCGETLQKSLVNTIFDRFPNIRIINSYSPTEATCAVSAIEITKEMLEYEDILPIGEMSTTATAVEIMDGEIVLRGKSVFEGYLGKNSENHFIEHNENCYRTGDLGAIQNSVLYFKGRKDSQIKYKGYRVELSEIEMNISSVPNVLSASVIAKRDENGDVRMIKAFVTGKISSEQIRNALREKLPEYMIPRVIKILDKMPINQNGKIDRKELLNL